VWGLRPKLFPLRPSGPASSQTHAGLNQLTHTHGRAGSPPIVFSWAGYKNGHPCPWERKRERIKEQVKEEYNAFPTFAELNRVHSGREEAHLQARNIWSPGCWLSHVCSKEYFTRTNSVCFLIFPILNHPCVLFKHGCFSVNIYNVKKRRVEWLYVLFWQMQRGACPGIVWLHSFLHLPFCGTSRARRICEGSCSSSDDGDFGPVIPEVSEGCHLQVNIPANEITQKKQPIFWVIISFVTPQQLILNWNWFDLINRQNVWASAVHDPNLSLLHHTDSLIRVNLDNEGLLRQVACGRRAIYSFWAPDGWAGMAFTLIQYVLIYLLTVHIYPFICLYLSIYLSIY